jgi:hypothetical protein
MAITDAGSSIDEAFEVFGVPAHQARGHEGVAGRGVGSAGRPEGRDPKRGRQGFRQYVEKTWFPNHMVEQTTRENYRYQLDAYILDEFGHVRMREILPGHVRGPLARRACACAWRDTRRP